MQHDPHSHSVIRIGNLFVIPEVATVTALPHRRPQDAKRIAERIAREPKAVLAVVRMLGIVGISDDRYGPSATLALAG